MVVAAGLLVAGATTFSSSAIAATAFVVEDAKRYVTDVEFLLDQIEQRAGDLLKEKEIDWKGVRKEFSKEAKGVRSDVEHYYLCQRLLARARDGHAAITDIGFEFPKEAIAGEKKGVGLSLVVEGKKVLVKDCYGPAAASGVTSGFEVTSIDNVPARKWLDERADQMADTDGYSTRSAALYAAGHRGMADEPGTSWSFKFKKPTGGRKSVTLTCGKGGGNGVPSGPIFPPSLTYVDRQSYGVTPSGNGYIHLRKVPDELPRQLDEMLTALGEVTGLILDFRANTGGGCDHDAVMERFESDPKDPKGKGGDHPRYSGRIVVIVDAGTASAAETISGRFKASQRATLIGPTPTAGMSGSKEMFVTPSGLITVLLTVRSYRVGEGSSGPTIEGKGVEPDEIVAYDPREMGEGIDPFIQRAEELLSK